MRADCMEDVSSCCRQESLVHLLIAAAGSGSRMGADRNKLLLPLAGRPLLAWTLDTALAAESIGWIGIVGQSIDRSSIMELVTDAPKTVVWIEGGSTRQESVKRGLAALPIDAEHVLIHDGARCLAQADLFNRCAEAVIQGQAVIAATPVTDTIKRVDGQGMITGTPERAELWAAQTPQGFSVAQLKQGHAEADAQGWSVTDDASLYERLGWSVSVLDAGPDNIKVTTPFDLTVAAAVLSVRRSG
ncbi:MAG: 2-C-methyl-D-erythritol 4-phosphate cytidylyltransferase [Prochlorococcus marinus str. MIT 9215]|nr:MAG: 2-C-methyl-D-erythritol 4-phosphate cytidylyltransferase [Prochlorococcus marinus str. MIT 9215]